MPFVDNTPRGISVSGLSTASRRSAYDGPPLRAEDYCFGKRISDQRGRTSANFKPGAKRGLVLAAETGDELGPGGSYRPVSTFQVGPGFNRKGTFGPPHASSLKRTTVTNNAAAREGAEFTSNVHSSFGSTTFNRKGSWGKPSSARNLKKCQLAADRSLPPESTEFTSNVHSSFGERKTSAPSLGPAAARSSSAAATRKSLAERAPKQGTDTEYTTTVYSSFNVAKPSRAHTPPVSASRRSTSTTVRPSFATVAEGAEYTTPVPTSFPKPNLVSRVSGERLPYKKTDSWLHIDKDPNPGPGQYFVP